MTVRRIACLLVVCAALGSAVQASEIIHGRVLQAGNARLSIRMADGRAQVFSVRSGAVITLNGMRTMLEDLRPGYPVTVTTSVGRVAVRIDAKSFADNPGHYRCHGKQAGRECKRTAASSRCRRSSRQRFSRPSVSAGGGGLAEAKFISFEHYTRYTRSGDLRRLQTSCIINKCRENTLF